MSIEAGSIVSAMLKTINGFFLEREKNPGHSNGTLVRLELEVSDLDPFLWLSSQGDPAKIYWRNRLQTFETAGVGEAHTIIGQSWPDPTRLFERMMDYLPQGDTYIRLRYYGGMRFSKRDIEDEAWKTFGCYRFTVPLFELSREEGVTRFACNFLYHTHKRATLHQQLQAGLEKMRFRSVRTLPAIKRFILRTDFPDFSGWRDNIAAALEMFKSDHLKKIVLARKSTYKFAGPIQPLTVFKRLRSSAGSSFQFLFQPTENLAFLGRTPELLYRRDVDAIHSDAIAGTRPRGRTPEDDLFLEQDLLSSEKDLREHRFVLDTIRESARRLCAVIQDEQQVHILKLSRLQHLYSAVRGTLRFGINDGTILANLHPTPAVGGLPRELALQEINNLEPFDRGWYAGPVGWVGRRWSEFAVGIRSGLVQLNELHLYAGAGIVTGSIAEEEWEEIENKLGNFASFLETPVKAGSEV